jgi:hypothetical protein
MACDTDRRNAKNPHDQDGYANQDKLTHELQVEEQSKEADSNASKDYSDQSSLTHLITLSFEALLNKAFSILSG